MHVKRCPAMRASGLFGTAFFVLRAWCGSSPPTLSTAFILVYQTYRYNQMLHIGNNRSTVDNSAFRSSIYQCLDPVNYMGTVEQYIFGLSRQRSQTISGDSSRLPWAASVCT